MHTCAKRVHVSKRWAPQGCDPNQPSPQLHPMDCGSAEWSQRKLLLQKDYPKHKQKHKHGHKHQKKPNYTQHTTKPFLTSCCTSTRECLHHILAQLLHASISSENLAAIIFVPRFLVHLCHAVACLARLDGNSLGANLDECKGATKSDNPVTANQKKKGTMRGTHVQSSTSTPLRHLSPLKGWGGAGTKKHLFL